MTNCREIYDYINSYAPVNTQEGFDNAGFLFGDKGREVKTALLALDATSGVIAEAADKGAQLIITHHPLIFHPLKNVLADNPVGRKIIALSKNDICVISMHTNLDKAAGGVNDILIKTLGADKIEVAGESCPFMRVGYLEKEENLQDFLRRVKSNLKSNGLRYHDAGRPVRKIACLGGAGGGYLYDAFSLGCDTYVTSDIKYDTFLDAAELGINLIDADHFCTENPVIFDLKNRLDKVFPDVSFIISERHCQTARFF